MKKLIIAPLMLAALFAAVSGDARASLPTPSPTDAEFGACRWYCNDGRSSTTRSRCDAVCPGECEQVC
jgi:hypothetical protein